MLPPSPPFTLLYPPGHSQGWLLANPRTCGPSTCPPPSPCTQLLSPSWSHQSWQFRAGGTRSRCRVTPTARDTRHATLTCFFISWDPLGAHSCCIMVAVASCKAPDTQVLVLPSHMPPTSRPWWVDALPEPPGSYAVPTSSRLSV